MLQHRIGGAGGGSVGLDWRMPQREGWQRRARKATAHACVGATAICPSSVTRASRRLGGGRIFPGTDVSLHVPKDKW